MSANVHQKGPWLTVSQSKNKIFFQQICKPLAQCKFTWQISNPFTQNKTCCQQVCNLSVQNTISKWGGEGVIHILSEHRKKKHFQETPIIHHYKTRSSSMLCILSQVWSAIQIFKVLIVIFLGFFFLQPPFSGENRKKTIDKVRPCLIR